MGCALARTLKTRCLALARCRAPGCWALFGGVTAPAIGNENTRSCTGSRQLCARAIDAGAMRKGTYEETWEGIRAALHAQVASVR